MKAVIAWLTLIGCLAVCSHAHAQLPSWQWAAYGLNTGNATFTKVAVDAAGNTYAAGNFEGSLQLGDSSYTARGIQNVVIARYDKSGKVLWSHQLGDSDKNSATALAVDKVTGDVYLAGTYFHHIRIADSLHPSRFFLYAYPKDIFLVKYTASGQFCWSHTFSTPFDDELMNMDVDSRHNLVMGGYFVGAGASPPIIDSMNLGSIRLVGHGDMEIFIAKCDSSGSFIWAKNPGGKATEAIEDIHLDGRDNIVITGRFNYEIKFDAVTIRNIDQGLFGGGSFIALFDPSGTAIWAKPIGGIGPFSGSSYEAMYANYCAVDSAGNPYVGGNYTGGTLIFDATDRSNALPGGGQWLAKYSAADGTVLWTKRPGAGNGYMGGMCTDREGSLYVTGACSRGAVYGSDTVKASGFQNLLVLKYDPSGKQLWMQNAGDVAAAGGSGIAVAVPDEPVVAGTFYRGSSINFGSTTCYNMSTEGNGFVAKLKPVAASVPKAKPSEVRIYPNPTRSELHLEQDLAGSYSRYTLINALGQRVAEGKLNPEQPQTIQLPQVAPGIYYLELSGDAGAVRKPISIQPWD